MKPPQPNYRLRAARERAHLSRNRLAEAASLWLATRDPKGRDVAFDANHLGKIERGLITRPRDHYVAALCAVLKMTEAELGFDHSSRATPEDVDRKAFLQAALGAGAGALIARQFPEHGATDLLAAVSGPTAHYRRMGDVVSTTELTPAVEAHLRLASSIVTGALPTQNGLAALSEAAVLAAWVARERDDAGTSRQHYAQAVHFAERAQHPLLTAFMLLSRGSFMVESGDHRRGLILLQQSRKELQDSAAPDTAHALLASFHADAHAEMGDRAHACAELRMAESLINRNRGELRWPWVFAFGVADVARWQASTLAKLDDLAAARAAFGAAAPALAAPRRRADAQLDQARALAHAGHVGEACALALDTALVSHQYGFERIIRRVHGLRAELPVNTREAVTLDEALNHPIE
jgi:transcriptional regulator with XRE-family HTH domain